MSNNNSTPSTFNPIAKAVVAAKTKVGQNRWIRSRSVMCWKCQKDKPQSQGRFSFLIKRSGDSMTSGNSLRKFICFDCKPEEPK